MIVSPIQSSLPRPLTRNLAGERRQCYQRHTLGDEVEGEDDLAVMGGFAYLFREGFLDLCELGVASELRVSSLSVQKNFRNKERKNGHRKLTIVGGTASRVFPTRLLIYGTSFCAMQKQAVGTSATLPTATSICPTRVGGDEGSIIPLRPSYESLSRCSCTITCHTHPPREVVSRRPEILRHPK